MMYKVINLWSYFIRNLKILFRGARYIYTCTTPDLVVELLLGCPTWYFYREINASETLISVMLKLGENMHMEMWIMYDYFTNLMSSLLKFVCHVFLHIVNICLSIVFMKMNSMSETKVVYLLFHLILKKYIYI